MLGDVISMNIISPNTIVSMNHRGISFIHNGFFVVSHTKQGHYLIKHHTRKIDFNHSMIIDDTDNRNVAMWMWFRDPKRTNHRICQLCKLHHDVASVILGSHWIHDVGNRFECSSPPNSEWYAFISVGFLFVCLSVTNTTGKHMWLMLGHQYIQDAIAHPYINVHSYLTKPAVGVNTWIQTVIGVQRPRNIECAM